MKKTTETLFDYVSKHGERPAAKALGIPYSMLRRANKGRIRPSPKVLDAAERLGLDRQATILAWDTRHQGYLGSDEYQQNVARAERARDRRLKAEATGPEGTLGTRRVVIGVEGAKMYALESVEDGRLWAAGKEPWRPVGKVERQVFEARVPWPCEAWRTGNLKSIVDAGPIRRVVTSSDTVRVRRRRTAERQAG